MATTEHQIPPVVCRNRLISVCASDWSQTQDPPTSANLSLQRIDAGLTSMPTLIGFEAVSLKLRPELLVKPECLIPLVSPTL